MAAPSEGAPRLRAESCEPKADGALKRAPRLKAEG